MPKEQKRDNAYYEQQLKSRYPAAHSDFLAGKYKSLREALISTGIKRPRSRLQEMKNAWLNATPTEQREFARWLRARIAAAAAPSASTGGGSRPIAVDRRLETWVASRIEVIRVKRSLTIGDVMHEMGFKRLDASLGRALARGDRLQPDLITALEGWLTANKGI